MANLFRILRTKCHQNRSRFVEDMTKTLWRTSFLETAYFQHFVYTSVNDKYVGEIALNYSYRGTTLLT